MVPETRQEHLSGSARYGRIVCHIADVDQQQQPGRDVFDEIDQVTAEAGPSCSACLERGSHEVHLQEWIASCTPAVPGRGDPGGPARSDARGPGPVGQPRRSVTRNVR
jgi:hypothetical protein